MKRLFFDIEVTPNVVYSWRIGDVNIGYENIIEERKIICIAYKWEDQENVDCFYWQNGDDKKMIQRFIEVMNQADEVIGHNGDKFDIRWLRTRCIYHDIEMFPDYQSLDTLKKAKSGFLFNSNKLDYIAQFLGVGEKLDTNGFGLWKKVMSGDEKALKKMVDYCCNDVEILERVYKKLSKYIKPSLHVGVLNGGYKHSCPHCGNEKSKRNKTSTTVSGLKRFQMKCSGCLKYWTISERDYNSGENKEIKEM